MPLLSNLRVLPVLAAALMLAAFAQPASANPKVGEMAPEFTGSDSKGASHALSKYRGKTVILEWTNHGCPYVQKHYGTGNMQSLQKETTGNGIVWLTVVSSSPGTQGYVAGLEADELTATRKASPSAVLLDPTGKIGHLYGATATPHMFVIAPDGKLVYSGAIDDKPTSNHADVKTAVNYIKNALSAIAAGKPASPSTTRAYGCSIKYGS